MVAALGVSAETSDPLTEQARAERAEDRHVYSPAEVEAVAEEEGEEVPA